jgi:hypothetical protein
LQIVAPRRMLTWTRHMAVCRRTKYARHEPPTF